MELSKGGVSMDNKKIGEFIKKLMQTKGMNQEDLAKAIGISPQAVSKSLNGVNTFDIANLQIISELFKVTIDDLLKGNLNTSTSFMTDQERIVRLGIRAVESAEPSMLMKYDEKERCILHYAIEQESAEIIKFIVNKGYFRKDYGHYIVDTNRLSKNIIKILIDNNMQDTLLSFLELSNLRFDNYLDINSKCILDCSELWLIENEKILDKLYYKHTGSSDHPNGRKLINLDMAVRYNNEKIIDVWIELYSIVKQGWPKLPGLEVGIKYNNVKYIKRLFEVVKKNQRLRSVRSNIDVYEAYHSSEELFEFFISIKDAKDIYLSLSNLNKLMTEFFHNKEFDKLMKYKSIASVPSDVLDKVDMEKIKLNELFYLFASGGMPSVQYNNETSVNNYVAIVNKIILRLTKELVDKENKLEGGA